MMRYIILFISYSIVNLKTLLQYKLDFFLNIISVFIWVGTGLFNIGILYANLDAINGWGLAEIGLLYGMWSLTFSIYNAFGNGILEIEQNIVTGKLDILLTKPVSPLFQIISRKISTMGIGFLVFGTVVIVISGYNTDIHWNIFKVAYLIIAAIAGGLLIFATYLILACLAFWFIRSTSAIRIGYDVHKFAQYPLNIYGDAIKYVLLTIFPYAFTNYFPVAFLLGKADAVLGLISPVICMLGLYVSLVVWRMGLKKYEGSGS